ncbi:BC1881 family protein [Paenibacillus sp. D51F]
MELQRRSPSGRRSAGFRMFFVLQAGKSRRMDNGGDNVDISRFSTKELSEELTRRQGVSVLIVEPYELVSVTAGTQTVRTSGPAVILINAD